MHSTFLILLSNRLLANMMVKSMKVSLIHTMSTQTNHTFWVTAYFDTVLQAPNSMRKTPYHEKYIKPLTSRVAPN